MTTKPKKRRQITSMWLDEISLVTSGDDPTAMVVISKANGDKNNDRPLPAPTVVGNPTSEEAMPEDDIAKDDVISDEEYVGALEELLTEAMSEGFLADVDDAADDDEVKKDYDDDDEDDDEPTLDAILKSNPVVAEEIAKLRAKAESADEIAKEERSLRLRQEMISKAEALPYAGKADEVADMLGELYAADADLAGKVEATIRKLNGMVDAGVMMTEIGKSTHGTADPLRAAAEEIRKAEPSLTIEQAEVKALTTNPSLYEGA